MGVRYPAKAVSAYSGLGWMLRYGCAPHRRNLPERHGGAKVLSWGWPVAAWLLAISIQSSSAWPETTMETRSAVDRW